MKSQIESKRETIVLDGADYLTGAVLKYPDLMAANGGLMVLENGSPKSNYKEIWDRDGQKGGQLDLSGL